MKIQTGKRELRISGITKTDYPYAGMAVVTVLLFSAMFLSWYLVYPAFMICMYRVMKYDIRIFSADYCILLPMTTLFRTTGGMSLLVYLCLFAVVWYVIRNGIRANAVLVVLLMIICYLLLRMQMQVAQYVLVVVQLTFLYIMLPRQDGASAERSAKAFCVSLFISSFYALLFRNTSQIRVLRGAEVPAYWGSSLYRFQGLFEDPNYFMLQLIVGIALLLKLRDSGRIRFKSLLAMGSGLTIFGLLTYSKTFMLCVVLLVGIYILWQFRDRKVYYGSLLMIVIILAAGGMLLMEFTPFVVIATRVLNATDLSSLTTGRSDIFIRYWKQITKSMGTFFFGLGFTAPRLERDTHNLFLEIMYYTGAMGLALFGGFFFSMIQETRKKVRGYFRRNFFSKYAVMIMVLVVFCTLHGVFSVIMYGVFYLAFLSFLLPRQKEGKG